MKLGTAKCFCVLCLFAVQIQGYLSVTVFCVMLYRINDIQVLLRIVCCCTESMTLFDVVATSMTFKCCCVL